MILDDDTQRMMLLEIIKQTSFSGQSLDDAYKLKKSIETAELQEQENGRFQTSTQAEAEAK
jgi:hypothetical protein